MNMKALNKVLSRHMSTIIYSYSQSYKKTFANSSAQWYKFLNLSQYPPPPPSNSKHFRERGTSRINVSFLTDHGLLEKKVSEHGSQHSGTVRTVTSTVCVSRGSAGPAVEL